MPIQVTIEPNGKVDLNHLKNIASEYFGECEITEDGLEIFFERNYDAQQYRKIVEAYYLPPESEQYNKLE